MANAFFISETYLKDNSPLNRNIDMDELYPFAKTAEEIYIQEAIGTALYDDLIAKIIANTLSANEIILCKKIRSALVWWTVYDSLPFIATKIRNIGVVEQNGDNLSNVDVSIQSRLEAKVKNKAMHYMKMLQGYLCENSNLFTEYCCANWNCSQLLPNTSTSNSCDLAFDRNSEGVDIKFLRRYFG